MSAGLTATAGNAWAWGLVLALGAGCQSVTPDPRLDAVDKRLAQVEKRLTEAQPAAPGPAGDIAGLDALAARLTQIEKGLVDLKPAAPATPGDPARQPAEGTSGAQRERELAALKTALQAAQDQASEQQRRLARIEQELSDLHTAWSRSQQPGPPVEARIQADVYASKWAMLQTEFVELEPSLPPEEPMLERTRKFMAQLHTWIVALPDAPSAEALEHQRRAIILRRIAEIEVEILQFETTSGATGGNQSSFLRRRQELFRKALNK